MELDTNPTTPTKCVRLIGSSDSVLNSDKNIPQNRGHWLVESMYRSMSMC